eukprot:2503939-Rhodomonas_salina.1
MGAELFGTFSKNPAGTWMAGVEDGVEIEELSDGPPDLCTSSSDSESNEDESETHISEPAVDKRGGLINSAAWTLATALRLLNTIRIEICNMDAMLQLIVVLLLVITANVGPSTIVWVAAGVYLGTCNHRGRVSQHHINKTYFPSTSDLPANFKPVYKFKAQDQCVLLKARLYAQVNVCLISSQILVAAGCSSDDRIYVDSGCAISIFKTREMMVDLRKIKPIVVQGIAGERTIDMAGDLHLPAVSNDGIARTIIVNGVLFDPESPVNLLSADQLRQRGFS